MTTILNLDASVRKERSLTKALSKEFVSQWREKFPEDKFIYRDIGLNPPAFISEDWIAAVSTPREERTDEQKLKVAPSDELISEVAKADILVVSTPMYNYGMPAPLKAWFDQVIRIDETFTFDLDRGDFPLEPVYSGKTMVLLCSFGEFGFGENGIRATMNHLSPHIRTASRYLGVSDHHEINIEYQEFGGNTHERSIKDAYAVLPKIIEEISRKHN